MRTYRLYGLRVKSHWPLPHCAEDVEPDGAEIELVEGSSSLFSHLAERTSTDRPPGWFHHARLSDGSIYLRWSELFEFLVSGDGRRIVCRSIAGVPHESFQSYMLGQVFSFALLKRGIEALLSTTVVIDGQGVAFLGDSGYGKSTLGATFVRAGYPVLTDDVLVLQRAQGRFFAFPGPPRIKLFPEMARSLFGDRVEGTRMDNRTPKLILPLHGDQFSNQATPIAAMYVLPRPGGPACGTRVTIERLTQRQAFLSLLENTFNDKLLESDRLKRQFEMNGAIASSLPIRALAYAKNIELLPRVRDRILADLAG